MKRRGIGRVGWFAAMAAAVWLCVLADQGAQVSAHIVPPEKLHPVAASYRRMVFLLNLNPVQWPEVRKDADVIARNFAASSPAEAETYRRDVERTTSPFIVAGEAAERPGPVARKAAAREVFEASTRAVARIVALRLEAAEKSLGDYGRASRALNEARQVWASLEYEVKHTDRAGFERIGRGWLELASAVNAPAMRPASYQPGSDSAFHAEVAAMKSYLEGSFGAGFRAPESAVLAPLPAGSATFDPSASVPPRLPPGHDINKQLPRPRQILNMTARGVSESETPLIALGDMAFDSPYIFGEPARSLGFSCNTCHNKGVTNPQLFVPGLSARPGGMDVSGSFFAAHASNGHFDPLDIPDLRGIRFTAPYGRNGRTASLREFARNVIVHEFGGPEPDPLLLDALVAYMNEFDLLPNASLNSDGTLSHKASAAAKRGEVIFNTKYAAMGGRSCATCHVPSDNFLDRKRHDIGTVEGAEAYSRDRALDTPTLLSARFTAPYFHDGSQPTLQAVNEWFNRKFTLGLTPQQLADLTAYVETVADGTDGMETTVHTLESEMEEFSFFLSSYEYARSTGRRELSETIFQTIALEIRAHKWDVQDTTYLPVLDELAGLMDAAYVASKRDDSAAVDARVANYRKLYAKNKEHLK